MKKSALFKTWKAALGIATEIAMTIVIMLTALGLCWLIVNTVK